MIVRREFVFHLFISCLCKIFLFFLFGSNVSPRLFCSDPLFVLLPAWLHHPYLSFTFLSFSSLVSLLTHWPHFFIWFWFFLFLFFFDFSFLLSILHVCFICLLLFFTFLPFPFLFPFFSSSTFVSFLFPIIYLSFCLLCILYTFCLLLFRFSGFLHFSVSINMIINWLKIIFVPFSDKFCMLLTLVGIAK